MVNSFDPDFIWLRDPRIALFYLKLNKRAKFILEVHEKRGEFFYKKLIKHRQRIKFCPINSTNMKYVKEICPLFTTQLAPMGIRKDNIVSEVDCKNYLKKLRSRDFMEIRIAYIGKFAPGHYSKGIEDLIELAKFYSDNRLNNSVTLIGANKEEITVLRDIKRQLSIDTKYLSIKKHIPHSKIFKAISNFDILVLPEYRTTIYTGMPIKLIEYIASGKITVVASTDLYRSLFKRQYKPFYYESGNVVSLHRTIGMSLKNKHIEKRLIAGIKYASDFTWENRTIQILG
jgi:glycosyltransferase involved in cell wall biosynthesis